MEETLTDCMVRVKEDLSQLEKVREYLHKKAETEEGCSFTWRTIEAFNSILSVCSSQNTPETSALDTLVDSLYYLARNNTENSVWENFGFELGIICVKVLSAIERTDIFEVLFCKLLTVITLMCEHNSDIWKAAARQILNLLINKKFSFYCLEDILKSYIFIIRNVESFVLCDFSVQNMGLLKMLSFLVQRVGDYEIQSDIVEMIFLHLSNDTKLMSDFFTATENKFFHSLQFNDFEGDCRLFLNALNKQRCELDRKVYSICCNMIYLGGCFVEPPIGRNYIWVDANKDTERVSFKCGNVASNENRVIYVRFSELLNVHFDNEKTECGSRLIIQTKNLTEMHKHLKRDDICLVAENPDGMLDFVNFLQRIICERKRKKHGKKASKSVDCLFIDIRTSEEVQDNAITSSNRSGVEQILPDAFFLPEEINGNNEKKSSRSSAVESRQKGTPPCSRRAFEVQKTVFESQELSPNSFAESLGKHLGLDSPESSHAFEDSVQTVEFLQKGTLGKSHKLFRGGDIIFNTFESNPPENFAFTFDRDKENQSLVGMAEQKIKVHEGNSQNISTASHTSVSFVSRTAEGVRSQNKVEAKLSNTQSQDYFWESSNIILKKKPCLPKLKRTKKTTQNETKITKKENKNCPNLYAGLNEVFQQDNGTTKLNGDLNKTRSNRWKLAIRGSLKEERKFKRKTEIKEISSRQGKKPVPAEERLTSSHRAIKKELGIKKSSIRKTKVFQQKETDCQQLEPGRQRKRNGRKSLIHKDVGREKTPTSEAKEDAKPSLLDPNGYAYKRWCEPTTSERSNFWLKKLNAVQKLKTDSDIFEFSDDLASDVCKSIKKRETLHSKRSLTAAGTKRTSLRRAKESLKKTSPLERENSPVGPRMGSQESPGSTGSFPRIEEHARTGVSLSSFHSDLAYKRSLTENNLVDEGSSDESISADDKEPIVRNKKRELSDEDSSTTKTCLKKKPKTTLSSKIFFSILRRRLQKVEERDRHQTNKIIQTVSETVGLLVRCLQTKDEERARGCLKKAEAAAADAEEELEDLNLREKRTQRAVLYFKSGCSVSYFCRILNEHFSKARDSLRALRNEKDAPGSVNRVGDRLRSIIKSELERTIKNEWTSQRDLLLKCSYAED